MIAAVTGCKADTDPVTAEFVTVSLNCSHTPEVIDHRDFHIDYEGDESPSIESNFLVFLTIVGASPALSFEVSEVEYGAEGRYKPFDPSDPSVGYEPERENQVVRIRVSAMRDFTEASFTYIFAQSDDDILLNWKWTPSGATTVPDSDRTLHRFPPPPVVLKMVRVTYQRMCGLADCPPVPDPGQGTTVSDQSVMGFGKKLNFNGEDNFQLFSVNEDGANVMLMTDNTYRDRHPVWVPGDRTKVAFTSNRLGIDEDSYEAFLADETTANVRLLTRETCGSQAAQVAATATRTVGGIAVSPDGTKLAYSAGGDILVIGIAPGSAAVELTQGPDDDRDPIWSQDGARIAFLRGMELWVMDADGSDEEFLLDQVLAAAWSPVPAAGRRIAVVRLSEGLSTLEDDGSLVPFGDGTAPLNGLALAWSPDGDAIAIHEETETIWIVRETGTTAISVGVPGDRIEGLTWRAPPP
jgi:hypothetical protein